MTKKLSLLTMLAFVTLAWASRADADPTGTDYIINTYNPLGYSAAHGGYGGVFGSSANFGLGSTPLADNYCLQYGTDIGVGTHNNFTYNFAGKIDGITLAHADAIAFLVESISTQPGLTNLDQAVIQEAIWLLAPEIESGAPPNPGTQYQPGHYLGAGTVDAFQLAAYAITHAAQGIIANVVWISPYSGNTPGPDGHIGPNWLQAQVATITNPNAIPAVPEPSSLMLLGLGGVGLAIGAYRRRRSSIV